MAAAVRKSRSSVPIVVERDGTTAIVTYVDIESATLDPNGRAVSSGRQRSVRWGGRRPGRACALACRHAGHIRGHRHLTVGGPKALTPLDQGRCAGARRAIGGGQRDPQTPMVGEAPAPSAATPSTMGCPWVVLWFFLAQLNLILAAISLPPLLPVRWQPYCAVAVFRGSTAWSQSARGAVAATPTITSNSCRRPMWSWFLSSGTCSPPALVSPVETFPVE